MAKVLVLYYSMYGHVEEMAKEVLKGVHSVDTVKGVLKRVPELVPREVAVAAGAKLEQAAPLASPEELADYDAIIFGTPTRFGNMAGQMRMFLDQTGSLWSGGKLVGKIGSVFTSTATGGGNEATILSFIPTLLHHGMLVVGLPYSASELFDISAARGGSPYGAGTLAGGDGKRTPSEIERALARKQGAHVAMLALRLSGGT